MFDPYFTGPHDPRSFPPLVRAVSTVLAVIIVAVVVLAALATPVATLV